MPDAHHALLATIASGDAVLLTGAGFSSAACDRDGLPLPDGSTMREELWKLCFDDTDCDDSTLSDIYDVALIRAPDKLDEYLARRLRIGERDLPPHLAQWLSAPWRRIYTLNVDDLEDAVAERYHLPRPLDVVHLNGTAKKGARELTFSTMQYAARLCGEDRAYAELARDLTSHPFVFAGTTLDEVVLWQHVELRRRDGARTRTQPARAFLVTPSVSRARRELLAILGVTWVQATVEEIAKDLPPLPQRSDDQRRRSSA